VSATRRVKRGMGAFFWFVFFGVEENEQTHFLAHCLRLNYIGVDICGATLSTPIPIANFPT
jgi:hypothetical protein